jgi:hypothetical protein
MYPGAYNFQQASPGMSSLQGAFAGAAAGSAVYPGWGTLIGGALGYFGAGGGG